MMTIKNNCLKEILQIFKIMKLCLLVVIAILKAYAEPQGSLGALGRTPQCQTLPCVKPAIPNVGPSLRSPVRQNWEFLRPSDIDGSTSAAAVIPVGGISPTTKQPLNAAAITENELQSHFLNSEGNNDTIVLVHGVWGWGGKRPGRKKFV